MSDTTEDAVIQHLRERKACLEQIIADSRARLEEVSGLLATLADGRTRVRRRLKEAAPPSNGASEPTTVPAEAG